MLFQHSEFILFLLVVFAVFLLLRGGRSRGMLLLVSSYGFYAAWEVSYLALIAFSTIVDFTVGRCLGRTKEPSRRRALLIVSVIANLGLLATFKYALFLTSSTSWLLGLVGVGLEIPSPSFLLPVGISFYTFQSMSYTFDVYRRKIEPVKSLGQFALYIAFFPQLVAGPIVRASQMLPQLVDLKPARWTHVEAAIRRFLRGLVKKVVIADTLAVFVDALFAQPEMLTTVEAWAAAFAFAVQIYCDFSGYTDMAIAVAMLFGIRLPENFDRPYSSSSVQEFWRRWHMTLSAWLRDYLYVPLGGSWHGKWRLALSLGATMLLGGLWHGAAWTFVLWGAYHAVLLGLHRAWAAGPGKVEWVSDGFGTTLGTAARRAITLILVTAGWAIFRAESFEDLGRVLIAMVGGGAPDGVQLLLGPMLLSTAVILWQQRSERIDVDQWLDRRGPLVRALFLVTLVLFAVIFGSRRVEPFIYFQF